MRICICDDEKFFREKIKKVCFKHFCEKNDLKELVETDDGREVLQRAREFELIILDIQMPVIDGIAIKKRLQIEGERPYIIFVTAHDSYMQDAFGRDVIGFVKKDEIEKRLPILLEQTAELVNNDILLVGKYHSSDVIYISSENEYVKFYMRNGEERLERTSMQNLQEVLQPVDFVRVHRKWLVNLRYVEKYEETKFLIGDREIGISVRNRKKVHKAYTEYVMKRRRYL